jgi:hypothetical protein
MHGFGFFAWNVLGALSVNSLHTPSGRPILKDQCHAALRRFYGWKFLQQCSTSPIEFFTAINESFLTTPTANL